MTTRYQVQTQSQVTQAMKAHDREYAPGSESAQWGAYVDSTYTQHDRAPWDGDDEVVDSDYAGYWLAVAERDYATAAQYGDVPQEWMDERVVEEVQS